MAAHPLQHLNSTLSETPRLLPNPLKSVVMQCVIPSNLDGNPSNLHLGAICLNLAEHVSQGSVVEVQSGLLTPLPFFFEFFCTFILL